MVTEAGKAIWFGSFGDEGGDAIGSVVISFAFIHQRLGLSNLVWFIIRCFVLLSYIHSLRYRRRIEPMTTVMVQSKRGNEARCPHSLSVLKACLGIKATVLSLSS